MDTNFILAIITFAAVLVYSLIAERMQAPLRQQIQALQSVTTEKRRKVFLIFFYGCIRANLIATAVLFIYITVNIRFLGPYFESPAYLGIQDKSEVLSILTSTIGMWPMVTLSICHVFFPPPLIATFGVTETADGLKQLRWLYAGYVYAAVWLLLLRLGYADNYAITLPCVCAGAILVQNYFKLIMQNTHILKKLAQ